jgi:acetyl esterase/lipase
MKRDLQNQNNDIRERVTRILAVMICFFAYTKDAYAQSAQRNIYITAENTVFEVINHSAFEGFGQFIFPLKNRYGYDTTMRLNNIDSLLPYHSNINTNTTVGVINYLIDEINGGKTVFYNFYADKQKQADSAKNATGLFFFRGKSNAPFAVICAGGGFSYVGSIHESFPHAIELSKKGYNAFVIEYRLGSERDATQDLAAALSWIFANAAALEVSTKNYSLWGASAGARMAANIGSNGTSAYGGDTLPKPSVVVMQYTGHSSYTKNDPPTFAVVGEHDSIASPAVMERRINNLKNAGIDAKLRRYPNVGHGFGLGIGTSAEGWIRDAIQFWEKHSVMDEIK